MVYKVLGLMSGSSLDGLDIAYVYLSEIRSQWTYEIMHAECIPFTDGWEEKLRHAQNLNVGDFLQLHTAFGHYLGQQCMSFIDRYHIEHQVHFIASHGHTVFHNPAMATTGQIGDGAAIAAVTSLPVISDLRALDVALGGQGAPIVPIGDKLLWSDYSYCLNIGGIANVTIKNSEEMLAFDVCPANQILNTLATKAGLAFDEGGKLAASGSLIPDVLDHLNNNEYYTLPAPKSLSNEQAIQMIFPTLLESNHTLPSLLHTMCVHIAMQVAAAVQHYSVINLPASLLVTGGGAFNSFLIQCLQEQLAPLQVMVVVPDDKVVKFKEAVVMALIGTLRWREETNVYKSVTGASRDSISGALWMGHSF